MAALMSNRTGGKADDDQQTLAGLRILLVEDEFLIAHDMAEFLEQCGASVILAHTLAEGMALFTQHRAGLGVAVLDINLNGYEVLPLADMVRDAGVPIVLHSAEVKLLERLDERFPGVAILDKPALHSELRDAVAQQVGRS